MREWSCWRGSEKLEERGEKEIGVCVRWFFGENTCYGEHVRRRTRGDGGHVPTGHERRQRPAVGQRGKGSHDSLFFSLFIWGLCVSVVEALSGNLVLFKCSDCRVIRVFFFPCSIIIVPVN